MPLTKIDAIPALVVIDLQKGLVGLPTVHPAGDIVARNAQLVRAFRRRSLPVVLVNVTDRPQDVPMPELPTSRFRPIGPNLFLNWRRAAATAESVSSVGAHSMALRWLSTCANAV